MLTKSIKSLKENTKFTKVKTYISPEKKEQYSQTLKEKLKKANSSKTSFYLQHSKYSEYIDPDFLRIFREELVSFSNSWVRMPQKNMSSEKNPGSEGQANSRILHSCDVALCASSAARSMNANELLAEVIGLLHDIAHMAFAHEGEDIISNYLQQKGICELHHSSLSRLVSEMESLYLNALNRYEELYNKNHKKPLTDKQKNKLYSQYLTIVDGAVCHNGEGTKNEVFTNRNKTDADVESEHLRTYYEKGFDRTTVSRSKEGCIVLFSDLIAYTPKDFRDGVIKDLISVSDPDYEDLFIKLGIPKETLDEWSKFPGKKDKIVREVTRIFKDKLVEHSKFIDGVGMDKEFADLLYEFRSLNYRKVVKPGLRKLNDILPKIIPQLIDKYSSSYIHSQFFFDETDSSPKYSSYCNKMIKNLDGKSTKNSELIFKNVVQKGVTSYIENEVFEIYNNLITNGSSYNPGKDKFLTIRRERLSSDIQKLLNESNGKLSKAELDLYVQRIIKEFNLTPKSSLTNFKNYLKINYPNASEDELNMLINKNSHLRIPTFEECLATLKTAIYIGESTNDYVLELLETEDLISSEECNKLRFEFGGDPNLASIAKTIALQQAEKAEQ